MKIEVHLLQNFPPSCLNRDDTNTPKDCEFGGVRRARISSQCIKRSIRDYFREHNTAEVGERTKRLRGELLKELLPHLSELSADEGALKDALDAFLEGYYSKMDSKQPGNTAVLLFLSPTEIKEAAACVRDIWDELNALGQERRQKIEAAERKKKKAAPKPQPALPESSEGSQSKVAEDAEVVEDAEEVNTSAGANEAKDLPRAKPRKEISERLRLAALSPDIALFGRMLAEQLSMRVEASCQVAHAISTHQTDLEMDFFTAVDDLNKDDAGAGMLGVTGYNAACFYRYALLDRAQLAINLGGDESADRAVEAFLEASVKAIPTGKQNSMAAQNPPSFGLLVARRSGAPASLANAFADPVRATHDDGDIIGLSIDRLTKYFERLSTVYGDEGIASIALFCIDGEDRLNGLSAHRKASLREAVAQTMQAVCEGSTP